MTNYQAPLNAQADRLEMLLQKHRINARCWGGKETGTATIFHLSVEAGHKVSTIESITDEIALALGVSAHQVSIDKIDGAISVVLHKKIRQKIVFSELANRVVSKDHLRTIISQKGYALIGVGSDGSPLFIKLNGDSTPHVLIAGTTGSGKTELARTIVTSIVTYQKPRDIQFVVVDLKGGRKFDVKREFMPMPVAKDAREGMYALDYVFGQMHKRKANQTNSPILIFLIDELFEMARLGGYEFISRIESILAIGREFGVCVIGCTQRPSSKELGPLMKANFPVRIIGKVVSDADAKVASGIYGTGAEKLSGRGDFILVAAGDTIRFQAATIGDS